LYYLEDLRASYALAKMTLLRIKKDIESKLPLKKNKQPGKATLVNIITRFLTDHDNEYANLFPSVATLLKIYLVIPMATASVERGFSLCKLIKTALRNRMTNTMLDALMRIRLLGGPIAPDGKCDFNFLEAVKTWYNSRATRRVSIVQ
jgi:hypothetical protein